ncbi:hypothetical protein TTHERM_00728860 (macronuclear) [Tetrahymena thermophila SB210]|uniref:Uncharacterized protein n=1 Tax=Tetrahymena thermophila (strain SB210) TaxID=312017 RepID=I7M365_TETTS|nr:hypothetical protein TTHERM_00728860 [Tetrahymena thermophila SB210]EAS02427.2 hypothetical protein TTHERM_00728860 [Tetrahymena thermophila SB210]|eukprot:XP_001022672.2 hypothetical protein TTHERM_00728860 [Tetrahymena thermophila SB210]
MNNLQLKQLEVQKSHLSTPQKLQNQEILNDRLIIQGNKTINQPQEQVINQQNYIRSRILSVSNEVQDAKNIMQNAQIRMLMQEYDMKFNPKNKRIRPTIRDPYLSKSQSSLISSIGATLNSQSQQMVIEQKGGDLKNDQDIFIDRLQELVTDYQQSSEENKDKQLNLPTISSKIVHKISNQINKINQNMQYQSKESLYTAQKAFTQSTMNTDQSYQKQKSIFQTELKQTKQRRQSLKTRSFSEKKLRRGDSSDIYENDKQILEKETNISINFTQLNDTTAAHILTSPSEKKLTSPKKIAQKPKNLDFIQSLSNYSQQNWTELLHQRINNLDYQNASKDTTARGRQLIQLFESFIINEINQCSQEEIAMSNSLILNEVCKHLEDMQFYNDTLLKKVKDNRKEKEELEVIELFGFCMKFNNPEHSDEFIQELKSFFERKYLNLIKKLRMNGNTSTQLFIDTLQNFEVFFKLYKDKLSLTRQKVDSLSQELEESHKLIKALEERAQTQHLARDRIEIEYRVKSREDLAEIQNRYELLYNQRVEESKNQIKKLEQNIESLKDQIKQKDAELDKKQTEIENYEKRLNKKKVDASTQIQLHIMPYVQNQQPKVTPQQDILPQNVSQQQSSNPFSSFGNEFMSPFTFSKSCSGAFISQILTECVFHDFSLFYRHKFCSFYANQNYNHLVNFSHHFFITKFGNKVIGEIFLKNFVLSLQEYSQEGILRFIIFSQLTGLDIQQQPQTTQNQLTKNNLNRSTMSSISMSSQQNAQQSFSQFVKKIFWESKQSYIIYIKVAILFRKSLLKNTNSQQHIMSGIYSLFDNTELLNKAGQTEGYENATILITRAQPIIQEIVSDHLSKSESILEVFKVFQTYIKQQVNKQKQKSPYKQVQEEDGEVDEKFEQNSSSTIKIIKNSNKNLNQNKQSTSGLRVNMDQIAFFIIDYLADLKNKQLDHFMASIKSIQNQKRTQNISIKDFTNSFNQYFAYAPFISDSQSYTDDLFTKFTVNSTTALSGGEDQRKLALKPFLMALFDEYNEYDSSNLSFYLSTEYLSQQAQQNFEKVQSSNKSQQSLVAPKVHTSQSNRLNKTQDGKRSNSNNNKKQTDGISASQKNLLNEIVIQQTVEQQVIQILQEDIFDVPNNIITIFESYEQIRPLIKSEETLDERIKLENEKFKSLLQQLNKIKYELKQSSENNPTISYQPRKSYIDTIKSVQQNLNNLMLLATSKLKLSVNF